MVDVRVAVAGGDVEVAGWCAHRAGGLVEGHPFGAGLVQRPEGLQDLAVPGADADGVIAAVGDVEAVLGVDPDVVGQHEKIASPAREELTVPVEHDDLVTGLAVEHVAPVP